MKISEVVFNDLAVTVATLRVINCEIVDKEAKDANSLKRKLYLPFTASFRQAL
jgi:hypothetical protein